MARRTLSKSVAALAIEPLTMALTVTGRKAYDVMLWIAQRSTADADGGFTSPVSAILRGFGSTTNASQRLQRYIEQMVQTTVVWRPLADSDQANMVLEGFEAPEGSSPHRDTDEARTFALLAEARLYMRGGQAWVTWFYPPSIREQLLNPQRWAQIDLASIARLSTYTAVALYEICARYKDSPGGLTGAHEPQFWTRVLREGGFFKLREWRKFKFEMLVPAIAEIGEVTEIDVELIERRQHQTLTAVQFKVSRKVRRKVIAPDAADVTLVMRAAKLGVRESDLDALVMSYGALQVTQGMDAMEAHMAQPGSARIMNRGAYLKAVLSNQRPEGGAPGPLSPPEVGPVSPGSPSLDDAVEKADAQQRVKERDGLVQEWMAHRQRQLRAEFAALPDDERARWIDEAAPDILRWSFTTPAMRKRLAERDWESPLIRGKILDVYAKARHGPGWAKPSEMDLVMFAAATRRDRS